MCLPDRCSTGTVGQALFWKDDEWSFLRKTRELIVLRWWQWLHLSLKKGEGIHLRSSPCAIDSHMMKAATRCWNLIWLERSFIDCGLCHDKSSSQLNLKRNVIQNGVHSTQEIDLECHMKWIGFKILLKIDWVLSQCLTWTGPASPQWGLVSVYREWFGNVTKWKWFANARNWNWQANVRQCKWFVNERKWNYLQMQESESDMQKRERKSDLQRQKSESHLQMHESKIGFKWQK